VIGGSQPTVDAGRGLGLTGSLEKVVELLAHWRLSRFIAQALGLLGKSLFKREGVFDPAALLHGATSMKQKPECQTPIGGKGSIAGTGKISAGFRAYKKARCRDHRPKKGVLLTKLIGRACAAGSNS
jgi:hypothetical protein